MKGADYRNYGEFAQSKPFFAWTGRNMSKHFRLYKAARADEPSAILKRNRD
jgi:hypothetical protein